ncbi:MAG: AAA family ATPase, partial [Isosphaeraceae bacterium]
MTTAQKEPNGNEACPAATGALDYLTVKGFRSIKSIEKLELRRINVLVGANGSGKSNFLGVFELLREIRNGRLVDYTARAGGAEKILHFGSKVTSEIELEISFRGGVNGYHVVLSPTIEDRFYVREEAYTYRGKDDHPLPYIERFLDRGPEARISDSKEQNVGRLQEMRPVQSWLSSWRKYHFHDTSSLSPMRKTADVDDNRLLRPDARNLAAFLFLLHQRHQPEYQLIRKTVQLVAPFFDDFHLEPLRLNPDKIKLEWTHKSTDAYFDASSLSDGTLRFICLATLFLQPPEYRPSVIIVDEPELGLHAYAITMLASLVKSAATDTQVVLATQSALLLDHFEPEDVLVADLEEGATTLKRLDSQELAGWLEDYSLGQLWEKNQFGGRP